MNADVWSQVRKAWAAGVIQDAFRSHQLRHCRHPKWPDLLRRLARVLDRHSWHDLTASEVVRRGWRCEPESWLSELARDASTARVIAHEVRCGLWAP